MANSEVDIFFEEQEKWKQELFLLRKIVLISGLSETLKWRTACYTDQGKNIALLGSTKSFCSLSFLKGVLLKDKQNLLTKPGENSQSARYLAFQSVSEIREKEGLILRYLEEAKTVERSGKTINRLQVIEEDYPEVLRQVLAEDHEFKNAFESLTEGRKRGYLIFINAAKQEETKRNRLAKYRERILSGKGINDCVCGHSKRMPNCDGSHKYYEETAI